MRWFYGHLLKGADVGAACITFWDEAGCCFGGSAGNPEGLPEKLLQLAILNRPLQHAQMYFHVPVCGFLTYDMRIFKMMKSAGGIAGMARCSGCFEFSFDKWGYVVRKSAAHGVVVLVVPADTDAAHPECF